MKPEECQGYHLLSRPTRGQLCEMLSKDEALAQYLWNSYCQLLDDIIGLRPGYGIRVSDSECDNEAVGLFQLATWENADVILGDIRTKVEKRILLEALEGRGEMLRRVRDFYVYQREDRR